MGEKTCCDLCKAKGLEKEAVVDAKTPWGPWAFLCEACEYRLKPSLKTKLAKGSVQ